MQCLASFSHSDFLTTYLTFELKFKGQICAKAWAFVCDSGQIVLYESGML